MAHQVKSLTGYAAMATTAVAAFVGADFLYKQEIIAGLPTGTLPIILVGVAFAMIMTSRRVSDKLGTKGLTKSGIITAVALLIFFTGNKFALVEIQNEIKLATTALDLSPKFIFDAARQFIFDTSATGIIQKGLVELHQYTGAFDWFISASETELATRRNMRQYISPEFQVMGYMSTGVVLLLAASPISTMRGIGFSLFPVTRKFA